MDLLHLKDVRCFRGDLEVPLAPLTILVGENSTGKSTLLALTRVAWDIAFGQDVPDFNEEPFLMGAYQQLAHYHGGQGKRASSFSVGFTTNGRSTGSRLPRVANERNAQDRVTILGTFSNKLGQPALVSILVESAKTKVQARLSGKHVEISFHSKSKNFVLESKDDEALHPLSIRSLLQWVEMRSFSVRHGQSLARGDLFSGVWPPDDELESIREMLLNMVGPYRFRRDAYGLARPIAMAPIRSRPKRTYDPLKETRSPDGDHVPMTLARLSASSEGTWKMLAEGLSNYGRASGLFDEVSVARFKGGDSSPFQLLVRLPGQKKVANLVDVGYGVSQVLPILVDALVEPRPGFFLMQQPEVHLHPRAQAELGSFLVNLVRFRKHRFLVETHSDHIVDRVRLEVKEGRFPPESVGLLFLERAESQVRMYPISLDRQGNVTGQPDSYRQFFLEESFQLIS